MSKRLTLSIRPEHALQYGAMFLLLKQNTTLNFDPVFKAMFGDFYDLIENAVIDQLTMDEMNKAARI